MFNSLPLNDSNQFNSATRQRYYRNNENNSIIEKYISIPFLH